VCVKCLCVCKQAELSSGEVSEKKICSTCGIRKPVRITHDSIYLIRVYLSHE
jgi:hypothetical protein